MDFDTPPGAIVVDVVVDSATAVFVVAFATVLKKLIGHPSLIELYHEQIVK